MNLNAGVISCVLANINRAKHAKSFSPMDFALGDFKEDKKAQSIDDMKKALIQIAEASNRVNKRKSKVKEKDIGNNR